MLFAYGAQRKPLSGLQLKVKDLTSIPQAHLILGYITNSSLAKVREEKAVVSYEADNLRSELKTGISPVTT